MTVRKKTMCLLFLLVFICIPQIALASTADWQIRWQDNNTLNEKITVQESQLDTSPQGWSYSQSGDQVTLERNIKSWEEYNNLQDKLPIKVLVKDYILFQIINFNTLQAQAAPDTAYGQVAKINGVNLRITVPGLIKDSSADKVKEFTALWHLNKIDELGFNDQILKVATFNGFWLGLAIIVLGLLIITIVFWRKIRKTHKLIEEEYSLTNITLPLEEEEKEEDKKEED